MVDIKFVDEAIQRFSVMGYVYYFFRQQFSKLTNTIYIIWTEEVL